MTDEQSRIIEAVLAAGRQIEANPDCYSFMVPDLPTEPYEKGCLLGWIGYHLNMQVPYVGRVEAYLGEHFPGLWEPGNVYRYWDKLLWKRYAYHDASTAPLTAYAFAEALETNYQPRTQETPHVI